MNKISRKAQMILENIPIEETSVSEEKKQDIYNLVMKKTEADTPDIISMAQPKKKIKPVYLIAAIIALFALLGAGYATSVYFYKMYRIDDGAAFEQYDLEIDDPEFLVDPSAFVAEKDDASLVVLDSYGYGFMESVFKDRTPGELFEVVIHGPDQKWTAKGVTGNGLNILYTISEQGVPLCWLLVDRSEAPTTQQVLDRMIADGKFTVTLEHPDYTPVGLERANGTTFQSLVYSDGEGGMLQINMDWLNGRMPLSQDRVENAVIEEFEANGYPYVLIQDAVDQVSLDLYLGQYREVANTWVSINSPYATKEQILDIVDYLSVHNPEANTIKGVDEEFFAAFPQQDIQSNAAEIAGAVHAFYMEQEMPGGPQLVWEQDGISIGSSDLAGRLLDIRLKGPIPLDSPAYPYGAHTALVDQSWFPGEGYDQLSILYKDLEPTHAGYTRKDGTHGFSSQIATNGFCVSPLDAIFSMMTNGNTLQHVVIVDANPDSPIVMVSALDGDTASMYSAVQMEDGRFLVQSISMEVEALPQEFRDQLA